MADALVQTGRPRIEISEVAWSSPRLQAKIFVKIPIVTQGLTAPKGINKDAEQLLRLAQDLLHAPGRKMDNRRVYMQGLAIKLNAHALSAYYLWQNRTRVPILGKEDSPIDFTDFSSMEVLARACVETLTAFNYLFVEPDKDADMADFRFWAWQLAGVCQRVELVPALIEEHKTQREVDKQFIEVTRRKIEKTLTFETLHTRKKKQVLAGRDWHPDKTLYHMCADAFGPTFGKATYAMLSSHVHSDWLSVNQFMGSTASVRPVLAANCMFIVCLVLARLCASYAPKWRATDRIYKAHPYRECNERFLEWTVSDEATEASRAVDGSHL
ncbi:MAG TPA: DUF5677 domain-containing protein [Dehalococcoidia bacterium]|nr:DUF5677 domain-containing protein [Dehalococcoidia bacterium]